MEASIIVEGFKNSEKMYGLRYHKLIADGDSSVYQKILESRPYKNITVEKVECRNHLLRNLCNKLKGISTKRSAAFEILRKEKQERRNQSRSKTKRFRKQLFKNDATDISYGNEASKPDMYEEEFNKQKEEYKNIKWFETRRKLLTASNFGKIIHHRLDTGCENLVKSLLYMTQFTASQLEYGRENESVALRELEKYLGKKIKPCGFFIDSEHFFLGATPDGLIDDDGIVEIKCPFSAAEITPEEGILTKKKSLCGNYKNPRHPGRLIRNPNYIIEAKKKKSSAISSINNC
ncbi:hypothetical protein AGLY_017506 [Aphis glycines]|uniref:Uncharacterized protein n=1 Tax=Aphis glycines TaxID=307491 RepID=A0A6G0SWQ1_APHGL|nr:hypothetical protein AGLY_017506 [Aphis glycines]